MIAGRPPRTGGRFSLGEQVGPGLRQVHEGLALMFDQPALGDREVHPGAVFLH